MKIVEVLSTALICLLAAAASAIVVIVVVAVVAAVVVVVADQAFRSTVRNFSVLRRCGASIRIIMTNESGWPRYQ